MRTIEFDEPDDGAYCDFCGAGAEGGTTVGDDAYGFTACPECRHIIAQGLHFDDIECNDNRE
jgi:hypothetical protein